MVHSFHSGVLAACLCTAIGVLVPGPAPLVAQAVPALSQPSAERAFSLADAMQRVRQHHPLLRAASGQRQVTQGMARQDGALLNPIFEWRKENYGSPLPRDEFISAGLQVDTYGRRFALRSASSATGRRALADSATTARTLEFDVARAYWRSALAHAVHAASQHQRIAFDTIAHIEEQRARQGAVSDGAALRARLEADRARLSEMLAGADAERAHGDLARVLAMPFDSVPRPTDGIWQEITGDVPQLPLLLTTARAQRSELASVRARVTETERRQLAERLGALPGIGLQGGSKRTSGFKTGTFQIGVSIPLLDRNGGNRERATGDVLMARSELRAAEALVDAEVSSAFRALRTLQDASAATVARAGLSGLQQRGDEVAGISATAYREGAITLLELLDSERVRADVRITALRAATELHLARLDLNRALGLAADGTTFLTTSK